MRQTVGLETLLVSQLAYFSLQVFKITTDEFICKNKLQKSTSHFYYCDIMFFVVITVV